jgi:hypothetical protein
VQLAVESPDASVIVRRNCGDAGRVAGLYADCGVAPDVANAGEPGVGGRIVGKDDFVVARGSNRRFQVGLIGRRRYRDEEVGFVGNPAEAGSLIGLEAVSDDEFYKSADVTVVETDGQRKGCRNGSPGLVAVTVI